MNIKPSLLFQGEKPLSRRATLILLALSGLATGLAVTFSVGILEWLSLIPAMYVLLRLCCAEAAADEDTPPLRLRRIYAMGLYFFLCYYLVCFHWFLYMYPLEFTGLDRPAALFVVLFAWWGLSLLQALGAALVFVVFVALTRHTPLLRRLPLLQVLLLPVLWVILEWSQTIGWAGVPWGRLSLGQVDTPVLLQISSLVGSYGVSFAVLLVNAALAYALIRERSARVCYAIVAAPLAVLLVGGIVLQAVDTAVCEQEDTARVKVAAIQGNIGSADKWDMTAKQAWRIYMRLTEEAAQEGAELIVWPETAIPTTLANRAAMLEEITTLASDYGVCVMVGTFTESENGELYNSIVTVLADGTFSDTVYSKRHLVPFGEYVPLRSLIMAVAPALGQLSQFTDALSPGEQSAVCTTDFGRVGSLICFDSIYEALALDSVRHGAQLLAVSTNDSWFFDSAAVHMHNAQAQLRAAETGRYVIRAANTGVSSVITSRGEIVDLLPALEEGVLYGEVSLSDRTTPYTRTGNVLILLCIGCVVALFGCAVAAHIGKVKNKE